MKERESIHVSYLVLTNTGIHLLVEPFVNHLAIRQLAHGKSRVVVQAESHIYCDSLDCVQTLSGLNLIPLAAGKATIPLSEVGAISIECPVRRRDGGVFGGGGGEGVCGNIGEMNVN